MKKGSFKYYISMSWFGETNPTYIYDDDAVSFIHYGVTPLLNRKNITTNFHK